MKVCSKCKEEKPIEQFSKGRGYRGGRRAQCKTCISAADKEYRKKNADKERARLARWKKENAEYVKERDKRYRERNIKQRKEYNAKWRQSNKEYIKERDAKYRSANIEKVRNNVRRRRARFADVETFLVLPKDLKKLYSSPCVLCGSKENITMDHVIPISRGGRHSIGNLQPLCGSCNSSKRDRLMIELFML